MAEEGRIKEGRIGEGRAEEGRIFRVFSIKYLSSRMAKGKYENEAEVQFKSVLYII